MVREPNQDNHPGPDSYRLRLHDIGYHLDTHGYNALTIIEVRDGLLVRASRAGSRDPELIEVAIGDRLSAGKPGLQQLTPRRLFPHGYAPFLEALGARLDACGAAGITLVEANDFVVVGGIQPVCNGAGGPAYEPIELLLLPGDIQTLLAQPIAGPPARAAEVIRPDPALAPAQERQNGATSGAGLGEVVHRLTDALRAPVLRLRD
jgi:hypothetical protein